MKLFYKFIILIFKDIKMKHFKKININNISGPSLSTNRKNKLKHSSQKKILYSQAKDIKTKLNLNSDTKQSSNDNIIKNKMQFSTIKQIKAKQEASASNTHNNYFTHIIEKEEYDNTKKYIDYLKEHLDSSYYAHNEINNKYSILLLKSKSLNEEIKNNGILYEKLFKSINGRIQTNNDYKKDYENFLKKQKQIKDNNNNMKVNIKEKIKELKQNNLIMDKENKSKEEVLLNLRKTLEILEKNKSGTTTEKEDKIKTLKKEKDTICKLKINIEKINKELITNNANLEEEKKSMLNVLNNNKKMGNENGDDYENENESALLLNAEIDKLQNIVENQKLLLDKIKENQKQIKEKINEQKSIYQVKKGGVDNNKFKQLIIEEKLKNKELVMELIKSKKEAKELEKIHNEIKDEYEEKINKIKDDIENLIKNNKETNKKSKNNDFNKIYDDLLEQSKNLKMFNNEFKEKLLIKKEIEDKIEIMKKENEKLKNISNDLKSNNKVNKPEEKDKNKNEKIICINHLIKNLNKDEFDKDYSVCTITYDGKMLTYNIMQKKFMAVNTNLVEGWDKFIEKYLSNYNGSLLCNTFEGLYILTGDNFNDLYYYSREKNTVSKIISFNSRHEYGGLIISPDRNKLIALGGKENKEVELLNIQKNTIEKLPDLLTERVNSSYSFIGNNLLYAFLGNNNNTIEYLDLNEEPKKWQNLEYTNNGIENIYGHISVPVNENKILIVGGKNNNKMLMFNVSEKILEKTDNKIPFVDTVGEYIFDKDKNYNIICNLNKKDINGKEIHQIICIDSNGNIHIFDNDFNYTVLLVDIKEI